MRKETSKIVEREELLSQGHLACAGCGERIGLRIALKALGRKTIVVTPAGCSAVVDGILPHTAIKVPLLHVPFETTASSAGGLSRALKARKDTETTVLAWAGDGATFDIGLSALSNLADRNEDVLYVCYDNESYMNTGVQMSTATPRFAWTTTTPLPGGKDTPKKEIVELVASHRPPYIATASIAYPGDFTEKLKKAKTIRGFKFIHLFAPCPSGWKTAPEITVKLARLAVETRIFPLYEVTEGTRYRPTVEPELKPIEEYLKLQGRFRHLRKENIEIIKKDVEKRWNLLLKRIILSF